MRQSCSDDRQKRQISRVNIADEPEESLPVIEKATADTEKDARPGIFFCTHPAQADMHR